MLPQLQQLDQTGKTSYMNWSNKFYFRLFIFLMLVITDEERQTVVSKINKETEEVMNTGIYISFSLMMNQPLLLEFIQQLMNQILILKCNQLSID